MPIYRPRVSCKLHVPVFRGAAEDVVEIPVRARSVRIEYNDHNHADTATIHAEWRDVGVDPRFLKSATCEIYLGNASDDGTFVPNDFNLRFIGIMTRPKRVAKDGDGFAVELEFHDYTDLFIRQKPFPTDGLPAFTDTLAEAWARICDHTGPLDEDEDGKFSVRSSVKVLRDRIEFQGGVDPTLTLGQAVAERFQKLAKVPSKDKADAWAVWQQCVGMLGLISYIDRDRCIVTTSTEHFGPSDAPRMIWGKNILECEEEANANFSDKGVAITSFDPLTGTTFEAFYPPPGDKRIRRKRVAAGKKKAKPPAFESERYDFFEYHGVTDLDRLFSIAQRVWDERSMQELQGRLVTAEMFVDTVSKDTFDLLDLRAGDNIRVEIDPLDQETLASIGSIPLRIDYLVARGYAPDTAMLIVKNMNALGKLDATYHAKTVTVDLSADGDAGKFEITVQYQNRIKLEPEGDERFAELVTSRTT